MSPFDLDFRVRSAAFRFLDQLRLVHGDVLPWRPLSHEFLFEGQRVPLLGPSGIWKPQILPLYPISIATSPNSPYSDSFDESSGAMLYRYRGIDPGHRDNNGLKAARDNQIPLIYFQATEKGRYIATYPMFVAAAHDESLTFSVQFDDDLALDKYLRSGAPLSTAPDPEIRRRYVTAQTKRRLHQQVFRDRVVVAYDTRCALCRLRHASLLDAAHIIPDSEEAGVPQVSNGLSLCKIHHAAYDRNFFGINADYRVAVRPSILNESDGPMLQHGIKEMNGVSIVLPTRPQQRPDRELLAVRFGRFLESPDP